VNWYTISTPPSCDTFFLVLAGTGFPGSSRFTTGTDSILHHSYGAQYLRGHGTQVFGTTGSKTAADCVNHHVTIANSWLLFTAHVRGQVETVACRRYQTLAGLMPWIHCLHSRPLTYLFTESDGIAEYGMNLIGIVSDTLVLNTMSMSLRIPLSLPVLFVISLATSEWVCIESSVNPGRHNHDILRHRLLFCTSRQHLVNLHLLVDNTAISIKLLAISLMAFPTHGFLILRLWYLQ
jgi:hypothetical protein